MRKSHKPILEVKNLDVVFKGGKRYFSAVKNATFEIYEGEILGLVGESGSGKSTIGRTIVGIGNSSNGVIKLSNPDLKKSVIYPNDLENLSSQDRRFIRTSAQYIFQNPFAALNPSKTIRKAVHDAHKQNASYKSYIDEQVLALIAPLIDHSMLDLLFPILPKDRAAFDKYQSITAAQVVKNDTFYNTLQVLTRNWKNTKRDLVNQYKAEHISYRKYENDMSFARKRYSIDHNVAHIASDGIVVANISPDALFRVKQRELQVWFYQKRLHSFVRKNLVARKAINELQLESIIKKVKDPHIAKSVVQFLKSYNDKLARANILTKKVYYEEALNRFVKLTNLSTELLSKKPHEMSGGQQQRAVIARALAAQPKLLVADEPVSALDVSIQSQVVNMLRDLREQIGVSILFIAHDLNIVRYISDRIIVMLNGEFLEEGLAEEIFKRPLHPYTKALLHAIPDIEDFEINGQGVIYNFQRGAERQWHNLTPTHKCYATLEEFEAWKAGA